MQMGQRPVLHLVAGVPGGVEGLDGGRRHHDTVVAVAQVRDRVQDADVGVEAHPAAGVPHS